MKVSPARALVFGRVKNSDFVTHLCYTKLWLRCSRSRTPTVEEQDASALPTYKNRREAVFIHQSRHLSTCRRECTYGEYKPVRRLIRVQAEILTRILRDRMRVIIRFLKLC